ncbi:Protein of unknown function [Fulvimarina manganoxydans]|uniref:DUF2380 domain-containing protein n=1 Tax=Fulvimarina manganoxydans TaxID=937218 RepID=A0A1W2DQL6_9HYPH|nr:DUF2380 domain-containing protein [Fulvimarina manganoxydans]SMC99767.1 Protein of unknown function [Fulvimarina manganoxydans]
MGWITYGTVGLALALSLTEAVPALAQAAENSRASVAVIGFDYSDSSGELEDQSAEHAERVAAFRRQLRDGIIASERFEAVELPCVETSGCTRGSARADHLLKEAREAGADYLVFGSIHKMSTLVGSGRVDVLDVERDRILIDRILSFRGDNDDAFARAAGFAAKDIVKTLAEGETARQREAGR